MKIYEPIAISLFTVLVLGASFLVGKSVGYSEAMSHSDSAQLTTLQGGVNEPNKLSLNQ